MANKDQHVGARVSAVTHGRLDLMKDLKGLSNVSDLVRLYVEEGLARDSVNIEAQIEERIANEAARLRGLVAGMNSVSDDDEDGDDMFPDEEEPVTGPRPRVEATADNSDLVPD